MVFAGLYTVDAARAHPSARTLEKTSPQRYFLFLRAGKFRGAGFRISVADSSACSMMEIIQERSGTRSSNSTHHHRTHVRYKIYKTDGVMIEVITLRRGPDPSEIAKIERAGDPGTILTNEEYVGGILTSSEDKRGKPKTFEYVTPRA